MFLSLFLSFCYLLNRIGLSWVAAVIRYVIVCLAPTRSGTYEHPDRVGYLGWVRAPLFGVLAFRRFDGTWQYRW